MKIGRVHRNLDRPLRQKFYISGCYGDIVFALAVVSSMGGGSIYIGPDLSGVCGEPYAAPRVVAMQYEAWFMKQFLESQPLVHKCEFSWRKPAECVDLNLFRKNFVSKESMKLNLCREMLSVFGQGVEVMSRSWVHLPIGTSCWIEPSRVLINKTPRFNNGNSFDWSRVLEKFGKDCGFIGTEEEYTEFVSRFGKVKRIYIQNAFEAAQALSMCDLFVGNPSFLQAVAQGAKVKQVNVLPVGDDRAKFEGKHIVGLEDFELPDIAQTNRKADFVHVYSKYKHRDDASRLRFEKAEDSWKKTLYRFGVLPAPVENVRRSSVEIGDSRALPYLKEVIEIGMKSCASDDSILIFTNDDTILGDGILEDIANHCGNYGACCSFRLQIDSTGKRYKNPYKDNGRDLFAFKKKWLKRHLKNFPDYLLGATDWDYFLPAYMRHVLGEPLVEGLIEDENPKVEIKIGKVFHEWHDAFWCKPENIYSHPTQLHNIFLTRKFFSEMRWNLKC